MPKLYIIAGCNGAGKTTASYTVLPEMLGCREFVNADEIAKGRNIYSFHRQVDAKLRQPLEYEQYKTLYSGGAVRVNNVWTSVAGEIDCCEVRYDRKTEKLKLRIVEPPREKKAQPKVAPRKPARGPKL